MAHHYHVTSIDRERGTITFGGPCECKPEKVSPPWDDGLWTPPPRKPKRGQKRRSSKKKRQGVRR